MRGLNRVALVALTASVAGLGAVASAQADSLVYVKNGYVWVARTDGSGARAVTAQQSSYWAWPSETDRALIAVAGSPSRIVNGSFNPSGSDQIYEFDQKGKLISGPVNTQGSYSTVSDPEYVSHFRVAPDNSYVAYSVFPSYTDSYAAWEKPTGSPFAYAKDSGGAPLPYADPEWWGTSHLVITHDGVTIGNQAEYALYGITDDSSPGWYNDTAIGSWSSFQVVFTRQGTKSAVETDDSADWTDGMVHNSAITLENSSGGLPNTPWNSTGCTINLPSTAYRTVNAAHLISMSFSADGNTLAWAQDDGIYEANVSSPANCAAVRGSVHLVVPGGSMPFLGAAPLSAPPVATPNTTILGLKINRSSHALIVRVAGRGAGKLTFQCRVDRGRWVSCHSGTTFRHLRRGRHTLFARARNSAGFDPTPAVRKFVMPR